METSDTHSTNAFNDPMEQRSLTLATCSSIASTLLLAPAQTMILALSLIQWSMHNDKPNTTPLKKALLASLFLPMALVQTMAILERLVEPVMVYLTWETSVNTDTLPNSQGKLPFLYVLLPLMFYLAEKEVQRLIVHALLNHELSHALHDILTASCYISRILHASCQTSTSAYQRKTFLFDDLISSLDHVPIHPGDIRQWLKSTHTVSLMTASYYKNARILRAAFHPSATVYHKKTFLFDDMMLALDNDTLQLTTTSPLSQIMIRALKAIEHNATGIITHLNPGWMSLRASTPPLISATLNVKPAEVFRGLRRGEAADIQDRGGWSALMCAAAISNADISRMLLESGANPNLINDDGDTALMIACRKQSLATLPVIDLLRTHGTLITIRNRQGLTAAMLLQQNDYLMQRRKHTIRASWANLVITAAQAGRVAPARALINAGIPVDWQNANQQTALMLAAAADQAEMVDTLLTLGARWYMVDSAANNAIAYAAHHGAVRVLDYWIKNHDTSLEDALIATLLAYRNTDGMNICMLAAQHHCHVLMDCLLAEHLKNQSLPSLAFMARDHRGQNALMHCVLAKNQVMFERIIELSDIDATDHGNESVLMMAIKQRQPTMVQQLLHQGANFMMEGAQLIVEAIQHQQASAVQQLLQAGLNVCDDTVSTPLIKLAAEHHRPDIICCLITHGADLIAVGRSLDPLHPEEMIEVIGHWITYTTIEARALHWACEVIRDDIPLRIILDLYHGDINTTNDQGDNALIIAARQGPSNSTALLLDRGADSQQENLAGEKAAQWILTPTFLDQAPAVVDALSERTTLFAAVVHGDHHTLYALPHFNTLVNIRDEAGNTPLILAATMGHISTVHWLLRYGANPDAICYTGHHTALTCAIERGHFEIGRVLLLAGARADLCGAEILISEKTGGRQHEATCKDIIDDQQAMVNASALGDYDTFHAVLEKKCSLMHAYESMSMLTQAVKYQQAKIAQRLITASRSTLGFKQGLTTVEQAHHLLMEALRDGYPDVVACLLAQGADRHLSITEYLAMYTLIEAQPALKQNRDIQASLAQRAQLITAARHGQGEEVMRLIGAGIPDHIIDAQQKTPLRHAVEQRHRATINLFLKNRSVLELEDGNGDTPIIIAARLHHYSILKQLISAGAYLLHKNKAGVHALGIIRIYAMEQHDPELKHLLQTCGQLLDRSVIDNPESLIDAIKNKDIKRLKCILDNHANPNKANASGWTPLMEAASLGHEDSIEMLIKYGANIHHSRDSDGITAFIAALSQCRTRAADLLRKKGQSIEPSTSNNQLTPLMFAAKEGNISMARFLPDFYRADINESKRRDQWTALAFAVKNGHEKTAEVLLKRGADPNHRILTDGGAILTIAAKQGNEEMATLLLNYGANPNQRKDGYSRTALMEAILHDHVNTAITIGQDRETLVDTRVFDTDDSALLLAARRGHVRIVFFLIQWGASIYENRSNNGYTPLIEAAIGGHPETIAFLADKGAAVNKLTYHTHYSPLMLASKHGHIHAVEALLRWGADPNQRKPRNGWTALMEAALQGHSEIIKLLLNHSASVNQASTDTDCTPLILAAQGGHTAAAEALITHDIHADIEPPPNRFTTFMEGMYYGIARGLSLRGAYVHHAEKTSGRTALIAAAENGHTETVACLLRYGAKVDQADTDGLTPLMKAAQKKQVLTAQALLKQGANPCRQASDCTTSFVSIATAHHWLLHANGKPLDYAAAACPEDAILQFFMDAATIERIIARESSRPNEPRSSTSSAQAARR